MAFGCVKGGECTGCRDCQPDDEYNEQDYCIACGEPWDFCECADEDAENE